MQAKISPAEILKALDKGLREGNTLVIKGYTSSSGSVTDLEVEYIGKTGYQELIKQSLDELDNAWNPGDYDEDTWERAKTELRTSWIKTLAGDHAPREFKTTIADQIKENPALCVLLHLKAHSRFEHQGPAKEINSKPLTLAKRDITLQLPLGNYIGRLNITPENITAIHAIEIPKT